MQFVPKGLIFPVSAVILERIGDYRQTLEHFSKPRLDLIEWRPTEKNNVEVLNETIDLYRYFDATKQAEFFFECVEETVNKTLPEEVDYLKKYDQLNNFIKNHIDMPDKLVDLLIRFLDQNGGMLLEVCPNLAINQFNISLADAILFCQRLPLAQSMTRLLNNSINPCAIDFSVYSKFN